MSILVGRALDTVETPFGRANGVIGGSATYQRGGIVLPPVSWRRGRG